jgi:YebC/PmpR family DNA-binding regulatory protein
MSGHSKWHNIQAHKGKQDAAKANVFTKCAKAIMIAAQKGGGDPATNFSLRLAIDKAKAVSMPKDNIDRAIKRGTGEIAEARVEEVLYEGFGPGGAALLIKATTDNSDRTFPELKHILTKHDGAMAGEGSVQWMFDSLGHIVAPVPAEGEREAVELHLIEAGATDIEYHEDDIVVITKPESLQKLVSVLKEAGLEPRNAELVWSAKDEIDVPPEVHASVAKLLEELENHDDVDGVYTNVARNYE